MNRKITVIITVFLLVSALLFTGCQMDIAEAEKIVPLLEPYITAQPASASYTAGASSFAPLSVEAGGWGAEDGTLTYQWHTFASLTAYVNNASTELAGETNAQLTLTNANLTTTANAKNYFYVVVTNTNGAATDKTTASVRSQVAVISFAAPGALAPPIITRQPQDAQTRFGRAVNPLSVSAAASAPGGGTGVITYQWHKVTLNAQGLAADANNDGIPDAQAIPDGTNPSYTPSPGELSIGGNFFFVEITYTDGGNSSKAISVPANINVLRALRAGAPEITAQPKPALYFGTEAVAALSVTGTSPDFGTLSYQWYSNASGSNKSGTPVEGATGSAYTPAVTAGQSSYYYVVVTNTNDNVINEKTASAASRAVNVRRAVAAAGITGNSTITLSTVNRFNYVRGYGGMDVGWANFPETKPEETEAMYDPDQLGYNILRIMIPLSNTSIDKGMADMVNNRRKYYYENVKIVNKHGGYVAAAPWSPPKEWKSNNSINGGGFLLHQYYDQYAAYLKSFAQHMYNHGAPIYAVSIQNEPNYVAGYDGCEWKDEEMRDFFKKVGIFTDGVKGWGGGRELPRVLTMNGESANTPYINTAALLDPVSKAAIDFMSRHVYGERRKSLFNDYHDLLQKDGKPMEVWMTEHNINSANATAYPNDSTWNYVWRFMNDVDLVMRLNNENAFVWWAGKRFYSMIGDGQFGTREGAILPRGWGLSHYSKYTIGMTRIGFTITGTTANNTAIGVIDNDDAPYVNGAKGDMDNVTARITAFASEDNSEISLVLWTPTAVNGGGGVDMGTIKIDMPSGFVIGSVTAIRSTSATSVHQPYDVPVSSDRRSAYIDLPRSQIVSVKFVKQ